MMSPLSSWEKLCSVNVRVKIKAVLKAGTKEGVILSHLGRTEDLFTAKEIVKIENCENGTNVLC